MSAMAKAETAGTASGTLSLSTGSIRSISQSSSTKRSG